MDLNLVSFIQLSDILKLAAKYLEQAALTIQGKINENDLEKPESKKDDAKREKKREKKIQKEAKGYKDNIEKIENTENPEDA